MRVPILILPGFGTPLSQRQAFKTIAELVPDCARCQVSLARHPSPRVERSTCVQRADGAAIDDHQTVIDSCAVALRRSNKYVEFTEGRNAE